MSACPSSWLLQWSLLILSHLEFCSLFRWGCFSGLFSPSSCLLLSPSLHSALSFIPQSPTRCLSLLGIGEPWHQSMAVRSRALSWQGCVMFFFCFFSICTWHMGPLSKCLLNEQIPSFLNSCSASAHNPVQTFILSLCLRYISGNACLPVTEKTGSIWLKRKGFYWLTDCKPRDEADLETGPYQVFQPALFVFWLCLALANGSPEPQIQPMTSKVCLKEGLSWKSLGIFSLYFIVWPGSLVCSRSIL